jgi:Protein of unknown function (DUF3108)
MMIAAPREFLIAARTRPARRGFIVAFALSLALHAAIYIGSPQFAVSFTPTKPVAYDASLVPMSPTEPVAVAPQANTAPKPSTPRPRAAKRALPAKSEANFTAPEGAIAVARAESGESENVPKEGTAEPATSTTSPAPEQKPVAVTEKSAPETTPPATTELSASAAPEKAKSPRTAPAFAEQISIEYKMKSSVADGIATFKWKRVGDQFKIDSSIQPTGFLVAALVGTIEQKSEGTITPEGLRPSKFSMRRGEGDAETADFERGTKSLVLTRQGKARTMPLTEQLQDMQSFLFQLAYDAPRLDETDGKLDVSVTNARKVYVYRFRKLGEETIDTRAGKIETIRLLSEAANPKDNYEVWLAPRYFYLPVKLKFYLGDFEMEQTVTKIGVSAPTAPVAPPR